MMQTEARELHGPRLLLALFLATAFHAGLLFVWKPTFYEPALAESLPGNGVSEVELIAWAPPIEEQTVSPPEELLELPEEEASVSEPAAREVEEAAPTPLPTPIPSPAPSPVVSAKEEPSSQPDPPTPTPKAAARPKSKGASKPPSSASKAAPARTASTAGSGSAGGSGRAATPQQKASYLRNPHPSYPEEARRAGAEGVVLLRVLVSRTGRVSKVTLDKSCGHPALDRRALETVKARWVFRPARLNGKPVEAEVLVPIRFSLR